MILTALNDYYQRLLNDPDSGIAQPGYSQEKISYVIMLAADGRVAGTAVNDLREQKGKKFVPRLLSVPQPEKRAAGIQPNFLWDKTSYALGVSATSKRSEEEHAAFKALHKAALAGTDDPGLKALLVFLDEWTPGQFKANGHFQQQGDEMLDVNVVFRFNGEQAYLHERPAARAAWDRLLGASSNETRGICLVTGEHAPIARLHPAIKGVYDAQSSGASIVSFNLGAFTSYGKSQGENAPVSEKAAFAYTTALNHLLRSDEQHRQRVQIGDTTVVFWAQASDKTEAEKAETLMSDFFNPQAGNDKAAAELGRALEQVRQGRPLRDLGEHLDDGTRIFVLGLAPNASRLSIRFWETDTLAHFARRLAEHYDDLELHPTPWKRTPTPYLLALTTAPNRDGKSKSEDVAPQLAGELTRAILTGARYPHSALATLVMRFRTDGYLGGMRIALCKAILARDARLKRRHSRNGIPTTTPTLEAPPVSLDLNNTDPGYLLGRLFSTLEGVQRAALGKEVNATIRDRYYGAASATPASIFPVLVRNAQNHLSKLRKGKRGLSINLEKDIGQIVDALEPTFPRSLGIEAQGRFAIGYYHQTQARFAGNDSQDTPDTDTHPEGDQE